MPSVRRLSHVRGEGVRGYEALAASLAGWRRLVDCRMKAPAENVFNRPDLTRPAMARGSPWIRFQRFRAQTLLAIIRRTSGFPNETLSSA